MDKVEKTLIAVLASHDSEGKNNELARVFEELYDKNKEKLCKFHFVFTGGTFKRLVLGEDVQVPSRINGLKPIKDEVKNFLIQKCGVTVLPDRKQGGVTILANLIVQRHRPSQ